MWQSPLWLATFYNGPERKYPLLRLWGFATSVWDFFLISDTSSGRAWKSFSWCPVWKTCKTVASLLVSMLSSSALQTLFVCDIVYQGKQRSECGQFLTVSRCPRGWKKKIYIHTVHLNFGVKVVSGYWAMPPPLQLHLFIFLPIKGRNTSYIIKDYKHVNMSEQFG